MSLYKKIEGIVGSFFKVGGPGAPRIKNNSDVIEFKNTGDTAFITARAGMIPDSGETVDDIANLLALQGRVADLVFSFAGGSPPSPNANPNSFGFCHTAGGAYTAGDVVYDNTVALQDIPSSVVKTVTTRSAISGTISLNANGIYVNQAGTWTLKGDGGGSDTGISKWIAVSYDYQDTTVSSTTSVPDGAVVTRSINNVTTLLNGTAPTVQVVVDGTADEEVLATTDSDVTVAHQYENETLHVITSSTEGVVKVTVTPDGSSAGAGIVYVEYVTPSA